MALSIEEALAQLDPGQRSRIMEGIDQDTDDQEGVSHFTLRRDVPLCGARCRDGHTCRARVVRGKRRCRVHGGLSTGPKTVEGRARIAESNRRRRGQSRPAT